MSFESVIRGIVFFVLPSLAPLLLIIFLALISSYIAEVIKIGLFATTSQLGFICCLLPLAGFIVCQSSSGILNSHLPKRFMDDHKTSVIMSSFSYRDERFAIKLAELIFFMARSIKVFSFELAELWKELLRWWWLEKCVCWLMVYWGWAMMIMWVQTNKNRVDSNVLLQSLLSTLK